MSSLPPAHRPRRDKRPCLPEATGPPVSPPTPCRATQTGGTLALLPPWSVGQNVLRGPPPAAARERWGCSRPHSGAGPQRTRVLLSDYEARRLAGFSRHFWRRGRLCGRCRGCQQGRGEGCPAFSRPCWHCEEQSQAAGCAGRGSESVRGLPNGWGPLSLGGLGRAGGPVGPCLPPPPPGVKFCGKPLAEPPVRCSGSEPRQPLFLTSSRALVFLNWWLELFSGP